jgi:hypothetical protein
MGEASLFALQAHGRSLVVRTAGAAAVQVRPGQLLWSGGLLQMHAAPPETYAGDCFVAAGSTSRLAVMTPPAFASLNEQSSRLSRHLITR